MVIKLLLYTCVGLVGVITIVIGVGYALPQRHVASRNALINALPEEVFQSLTQVRDYAQWRSALARVEVLSTSPLRWQEWSGGDVLTFEATDVQPPHRFVSRIADRDLPFGGTWTFALEPEGPGTRVTITEEGEVYNPFYRFMSRFVFGHTAGMESYLQALERRFAETARSK